MTNPKHSPRAQPRGRRRAPQCVCWRVPSGLPLVVPRTLRNRGGGPQVNEPSRPRVLRTGSLKPDMQMISTAEAQETARSEQLRNEDVGPEGHGVSAWKRITVSVADFFVPRGDVLGFSTLAFLWPSGLSSYSSRPCDDVVVPLLVPRDNQQRKHFASLGQEGRGSFPAQRDVWFT
ncbi:hypothetical protein LZ30DRAFT_689197 [Colletotrichum cereale]|nr:hypothetical protein LZ30DRAFT_689197 [Colletotrichum cereale]